MKFKHWLIVCLLPFTIYSCDNTVELNNDWEDHTYVYCVLCQKDTAHYIRIQRSYLASSQNNTHFNNPDSIYYNENLDVKIERWKDDNLIETIYFNKIFIANTDSNNNTVNNILYKSTRKIYGDSQYKLIIYIPSLNKTITGTTYLINDFEADTKTKEYFSDWINLADEKMLPFGWYTPKYGKVFSPSILFYFSERTPTGPALGYDKSIEWKFPWKVTQSLEGGLNIHFDVMEVLFFRFVSVALTELYAGFRAADRIELKLEVGSKEYYDFLMLAEPGIEALPDIPLYSNLENAYGVFASRNYFILQGNKLDARTWDSISCGRYTYNLRFNNRFGNINDCNFP